MTAFFINLVATQCRARGGKGPDGKKSERQRKIAMYA